MSKKQVTPTSAQLSAAPMDSKMDEAIKLVRKAASEKRTARQTVRRVMERLQRSPLVPVRR